MQSLQPLPSSTISQERLTSLLSSPHTRNFLPSMLGAISWGGTPWPGRCSEPACWPPRSTIASATMSLPGLAVQSSFSLKETQKVLGQASLLCTRAPNQQVPLSFCSPLTKKTLLFIVFSGFIFLTRRGRGYLDFIGFFFALCHFCAPRLHPQRQPS